MRALQHDPADGDENDVDLRALIELGLIERVDLAGRPGYRLSESLTNTPNETLVRRLLTSRGKKSGG